LDHKRYCGLHDIAFNRTIEELKWVLNVHLYIYREAFNRTIEELKSSKITPKAYPFPSFNRTIEELKLNRLIRKTVNSWIFRTIVYH